jgi:hypothetical protein
VNDHDTLTPIEALEVIKGIAEGSTTANSLPHIAKIAGSALVSSEAWLRTPQRTTGAEVEYAQRLATALHDKHYPEVGHWKPLPDMLGVLTQIDNMTAELSLPEPQK